MSSETFSHSEQFYNLFGKCGCFKTSLLKYFYFSGMALGHGMHVLVLHYIQCCEYINLGTENIYTQS